MKPPIPDARAAALLIALVASLTLGGALIIQWVGYSPCELCLRERIPYYVGVPLALLTSITTKTGLRRLAISGFGLLILVFVVSTAMGLYHAGVEWQFWPGPTECSGAVAAPAKVGDFLEQLKHVSVVRCDAVAMRILGLSLTVWNALISLGLVALANIGLLRSGGLMPRA